MNAIQEVVCRAGFCIQFRCDEFVILVERLGWQIDSMFSLALNFIYRVIVSRDKSLKTF